jgi:hypothetical protein
MNDRHAELQERWLADDLDDAERARLEEDGLHDPHQAQWLYEAYALQSALRETAPTQPLALRRPLRSPWPYAAGTLAAVLALVLMRPVLLPPGSGPQEILRSGDGTRLELIDPSGIMAQFPRRFRWRSHPGAVLYRWELYDDEARREAVEAVEVVRDTVITRPSTATPADSFGVWRWLVIPVLQDGREGSTSAPLTFELEHH